MGNTMIGLGSAVRRRIHYVFTCNCFCDNPCTQTCSNCCHTYCYGLYRTLQCCRQRQKDPGVRAAGFRDSYSDVRCPYNDDFTIDTVCFQPGEPMITPPGPQITDLYNQENPDLDPDLPPGGKTIYKQPLNVESLEQQQRLNIELQTDTYLHWYRIYCKMVTGLNQGTPSTLLYCSRHKWAHLCSQ